MDMKPGYQKTDVGVIPADWAVKSLESLADKIMVGIASAATHAYRAKGIPLFRNQNIRSGHLDDSDLLFVSPEYEVVFKNKRLRGGDLLTARTGYPGTTCEVPPQYESAQSFTTLITRPRKGEIDSSFLCHYINSEQGQRFFEQGQIGGAQKNVNAGTLRKMPIPTPSRPEQRAIAAALSEVDALLAGMYRLIAKKRDLKQAAMQQLLTGQTRLPEFQGEWASTPFGQVAQPRRERVDPRSSGIEHFCVELEHIASSSGQLIGHTSAGAQSSIKSVFSAGDVLFGKLRAYLRKHWRATRAGVCSTEIWVLAPSRRLITTEFLFQVVKTDNFIEAASNSYGTHMPRSDWSIVKNFELSLPPLPEQAAISAVLSDMDAELQMLELRQDKTRALKQAMMQELLTGRTRLV